MLCLCTTPGQDGLTARQHELTGLGLRDAARGPAQQLHAQLALERAHLLGERGLPDVQLPRRSGERSMRGDGFQVAQLDTDNLSGWLLSSCGTSNSANDPPCRLGAQERAHAPIHSPKEDTMKRRILALLAVPALALGLALASPGTDEARATDGGHIGLDVVCSILNQDIADQYASGNYEVAQNLERMKAEIGCY